MLYILNILNGIYQTYFNEKKRGSSNTPSVSLQLKGWDAELPLLLWDALIIWIFFLPYDIWEISVSPVTAYIHSSSYLCYLQNTVQHPGIASLPDFIQPSEPLNSSALNLSVSRLTKTVVRLSLTWASRWGGLVPFMWKLPVFLTSLLNT